MFEVELKFAVDDMASVQDRLLRFGAESLPAEEHVDQYFDHPCRRFVETGEALRVRRVNGVPSITYKGAKRLLVPAGSTSGVGVKMREELEWELAPGDSDGSQMERLLRLLGFVAVAKVHKRRTPFVLRKSAQGNSERGDSRVVDSDQQFTIALDQVEGVGEFVEVECLVSAESSQEEAAAAVLELATELGLERIEPRSYLRMVLEEGV